SGLIRTQENDFLISPLPQHLAQEHNYMPPAGHHPHVLYKRTAEDKVHRYKIDSDPHHLSPGYYRNHTAHKHYVRANDYHHGRFQKQHFCGRRKKYAPKPPTEDTFVLSDEYGSSTRLKRSLFKSQKGGALNVETLVVADRKMLEKHSKENVTTYILTVMNMVSSLFKDGTIGSDINIVVVSLLLLEQEPGGLVINHHADQSLNSFCQWQSALVGKNGKHHDHAILLTGFDICSWKNEPCDTLGFAPISGMCSKYRSCTINEDTGLGLAFTIAHESGHNTAQAACLIDEPKQAGQYKYPDKLPGQIYDADTQCKWQFGAKAKLCNLNMKPNHRLFLIKKIQDICKSLWCHKVGHRCETKFMPAAEGTSCGISMISAHILGDTLITNTALLLVLFKNILSYSGVEGVNVYGMETMVLNLLMASGPHGLNGRIAQGPVGVALHTKRGTATIQKEDLCKLYCTAEDFDFFFAMSNRVKDGTPCSQYSRDVCIDGICEKVGCDYQLGSKASVDACGVCKGDNSTCTFFSGHYLTQHKTNDYYPIVTIPAGARSIEIQELQISSSYLAVCNLNKKYYLTKDWTIDWPGKFYFAGTIFEYQRSFNHPERLAAAGPTNETLIFEILLQGKNPGIAWQYTFLKMINENKIFTKRHSYMWVTVQSECSVTCGGGHLIAKAVCLQDHRTRVNSSFCGPRTKPLTETKICNGNPCPAYWSAGQWSDCSKSCGGGQQSRQIQCVQKGAFQKEDIVPHALCPVTTPAQIQACNNQDCPPEWSTEPWSQCSKTCGRGVMKREVFCKGAGPSTMKALPENMCNSETRPETQQTCVLGRCPKNDQLQWVISSWSECTVTCGGGVQTRTVQCLRHGQTATGCPPHQKPTMSRACNTNFCLVPEKKAAEVLLTLLQMILLVWTSSLGATWSPNMVSVITNFMASNAANHAHGRTDTNGLSLTF
ncbi:hypothetical protein JD844_000234, partial [Phrynosoma platyrhinos]